MKNTVELMGLNIEVTFLEDNIFVYTDSTGEVYEEAVITEDGRLIAYVNDWVQLANA